ncbi:substrate-binding domain-containing protein [Rufibacter glacialis]|uniref:Substrate-binding domain-containing protein n=1 Tax=Rufibacter glacialis TaxID=1259555 RepID=A0A5M8QIM9_9BACT|nr:substrate-binding domain-containing protein [Rufibacter glacialis]KAA6434810.1 substrate-binding domain-containing protein [Rufibacter glacialis]GGK72614.1 transcriptional regulator [Rufibacter glacialis]
MNKKKGVVRLKDIAELAGVSTGTVDRVLHNRGRVADLVREKVLRIAKELSYEPNIHARALAATQTYHVAALIPAPLEDSYWGAAQKGIEKAEAELKQYHFFVTLFLFDPQQASSFREKCDQITEGNFNGVLIAPSFYHESLAYFSKWKRTGLPFIQFNTYIPDFEPLMYVGQDSYQSGLLAGKLLHQSYPDGASFLVAHIDENVLNSSHLIRKEQGFSDYFAQNAGEATFTIVEATFHNSLDQTALHAQLDQVIQQNPSIRGIYVTNSRPSSVAEYLFTRKLKRIRLIGYDLMDRNLHYLNNGTIDFLINQNPKGQGYWGIHGLSDFLVFQKKVSSIKYLPLDILTRENIQYYIEADNQ